MGRKRFRRSFRKRGRRGGRKRHRFDRLLWRGEKIHVKLRFNSTITNHAATTCALAISLYNPGSVGYLYGGTYFNGPQLTDDMGATAYATDWTTYGPIYDMYKVNSIKITYIPFATENVGATNALVSGPVETCWDFDNTFITGSILGAIDHYDNYRVYSGYRTWKRYIKLPKISAAPSSLATPYYQPASSTSAIVNVATNGYMNCSLPPMNGMFYFYQRQNMFNGTNINIGKLLITYYTTFYQRV